MSELKTNEAKERVAKAITAIEKTTAAEIVVINPWNAPVPLAKTEFIQV